MVHNVEKEIELYAPMRAWLSKYLSDKYRGANVVAIDTHAQKLDIVLEQEGVLDEYPHIVGLGIQIDVLGLVRHKGKTDLVFIEAKKDKLNLHHLGQLWAYCKLCDPLEAFLLSSVDIGSLNKVLVNLAREDLLDIGDGRHIKKMQVGKWDLIKNAVDLSSLVPQI